MRSLRSSSVSLLWTKILRFFTIRVIHLIALQFLSLLLFSDWLHNASLEFSFLLLQSHWHASCAIVVVRQRLIVVLIAVIPLFVAK